MKRLLALPLIALSLFSGCINWSKMPDKPLVEVYYWYGSQMSRYPSFSTTIRCEGDSVFAVSFDPEKLSYSRYLITEEGVMEKLRTIIKDKKMYRYKESYNNRLVLDGSWWGFAARFNDGTSLPSDEEHISSHGSNAGPRNREGIEALREELKSLVGSARFLYVCDEEGNPISEPSEE